MTESENTVNTDRMASIFPVVFKYALNTEEEEEEEEKRTKERAAGDGQGKTEGAEQKHKDKKEGKGKKEKREKGQQRRLPRPQNNPGQEYRNVFYVRASSFAVFRQGPCWLYP